MKKSYVRKENNKPWNIKRRAEKSVAPGDDRKIVQKFEWFYAQVFANSNQKSGQYD